MSDIILTLANESPAFILSETSEVMPFSLTGTSTGDISVRINNTVVGQVGLKGAKGDKGDTGEKGEPGDGMADPGDLTLIFENKLI